MNLIPGHMLAPHLEEDPRCMLASQSEVNPMVMPERQSKENPRHMLATLCLLYIVLFCTVGDWKIWNLHSWKIFMKENVFNNLFYMWIYFMCGVLNIGIYIYITKEMWIKDNLLNLEVFEGYFTLKVYISKKGGAKELALNTIGILIVRCTNMVPSGTNYFGVM